MRLFAQILFPTGLFVVLLWDCYVPRSRGTWREYVYFAIFDGGLAVWYLTGDRPRLVAVLWAGNAGLNAYLAWITRKPRQRKPSKALGKVRDLGHRLTVVSE